MPVLAKPNAHACMRPARTGPTAGRSMAGFQEEPARRPRNTATADRQNPCYTALRSGASYGAAEELARPEYDKPLRAVTLGAGLTSATARGMRLTAPAEARCWPS
ncbi:MAG: hypothetical protein QOG94_1903 [Solirubrobacteraceae bacterium]|nr:hypothetical protein [Solirubrobacteraceae bacterium]